MASKYLNNSYRLILNLLTFDSLLFFHCQIRRREKQVEIFARWVKRPMKKDIGRYGVEGSGFIDLVLQVWKIWFEHWGRSLSLG